MLDDSSRRDRRSTRQCELCVPSLRLRSQSRLRIPECAGCGEPALSRADLEALREIGAAAGPGRRRPSSPQPSMGKILGSEARLSWVLAAVAGLIGAAAFTHSAGYFVTFMTGNSERAVLGFFRNEQWLSITAALLLASFVGGVVIASLCRRHLWLAHPHGSTVLAALFLATAAAVDVIVDGWSTHDVSFVPVIFVALGIGALNTSFVDKGEVSIPLSYVTGTLVKLGQGIERHISGGRATDWLGYFLLWASFVAGAVIGGCISLVVSGSQMLAVAAAVSVITSGYTYFHADRRALRR